MRNKIVTGILLGVTTALFFACNAKTEATSTNAENMPAVVVDKEQIKKEIQAKEDSFAAVYNSGQLRSIGYYAEDATTYFPNRPPLVGKEAIINFLKTDVGYSTDKISFTTKEVFVSNDGAQVVEIGAYKVVDSANALLNSGHYMSLFEKRNGKYVAVRDMSASDMVR